MNNKLCFVIPARGGSKGIPYKNIRLFCGKPLIAWTIERALESRLGDVIVTSDSQDILDIAMTYGAMTVKRPKEISGDKSRSEDAIIHALKTKYDKKTMPDTTFFLQCTSPWIKTNDMIGAYIQYKLFDFDSMGLVKPCHLYTGSESKNYCFKRDQKTRLMRQDMEKRVAEVGAYLFSTTSFLNSKERYFGKVGCYNLNRDLPPEIDSIEDWNINEWYFKNIHL